MKIEFSENARVFFPRLIQAVEKAANDKKEELSHFVENGYYDHWSEAEKERQDRDNGIRRYSTETRWKQYQSGKITREKAVELATKRATAEVDGYTNQNAEKLNVAAATAPADSISISVEWSTSGNPTARVCAVGLDNAEGHAYGYGYDKESAAVADGFDKIPAIMRVLYDLAENALERGIGPKKTASGCFSWGNSIGYGSGYAILPYFEGGVGVSCFWGILAKAGLSVVNAVYGNRYSCYFLEKRG